MKTNNGMSHGMIPGIVRTVRKLLGFTNNCRKELAAGVVFTSIENLIAIWMIADLLGNCAAAIEAGDVGLLWGAVLRALPWLAAIVVLGALSQYLLGITTARASAAVRSRLMDALLKTSLRNSVSSHSGVKLSYFTNDINASFDSLLSTLTMPVYSVIVGVVCFVYVLRVHYVIALVALGAGLLTFLYSVCFAKQLHVIAEKMQALMAVLESRMKDLLDSMVVSRVYGMKKNLESGMERASNELAGQGVVWAVRSGALGALNNSVSYLCERGLIFIAGLFLLRETLTLPALLRAAEMAGGVIGVFHVSRILVAVQRSLAGARRVFDIMEQAVPEASGVIVEPAALAAEAASPAKAVGPALLFNGVAFHYNPEQPVLADLSFSVAPGELAAITGASGSGKSTVLRLCQGLYTPVRGKVSVLGVPLDEWDTAALRKLLSLVPQEPVLFPGSIAANIALGHTRDDPPDMDRVQAAAEEAFIHDFIASLPKGYQTEVAERGASLSGGQRQRIAIARALYRGAPILLLDEATSAVDAESETAIHATLSRLKGKKTILYVTHRETALRLADRVIEVNT